jgi:hypothetical protein
MRTEAQTITIVQSKRIEIFTVGSEPDAWSLKQVSNNGMSKAKGERS